MAVGRVGGTKAKISGQVGDEIYKIEKDSSGGYQQVVIAKPESYPYTNTDLQALQRMKVCMVETAMKQLKLVLGIAYQNSRNKTASVNRFASTNLSLIDRDCKDHWYGDNEFYYPIKTYMDTLGGKFRISAGTLGYNVFKELYQGSSFPWQSEYSLDHWISPMDYADICIFGSDDTPTTVGQFLKKANLRRGDQVGFVSYADITINPTSETPRNEIKYLYALITIQYNVPDSTPLSQQAIESLFKVQGKDNVQVKYGEESHCVCVGWIKNYEVAEYQFLQHCAFSVSSPKGKKLVSNSWLTDTQPGQNPAYSNRDPSHVFWSWIGVPYQILPYPTR